jgi:branched-chain amino acid aminotransferase
METCIIRRLTADGLYPVDYRADSLTEAALYEPREGVYTITNTFETYSVLKFDAHLDRLEDSAARQGIPLQLDRARLRQALRHMIEDAPFGGQAEPPGDVRFRVTVPAASPDTIILSIEPFHPLRADFIAHGIRCVTIPGRARVNPAAKTTEWMHDRKQIEANLPPGIYTALLLDDRGAILEGVSSNFYAIMNGELRTAVEGVLPGISQQIVFEVAPLVLPINTTPVTVSDLPRIAEAFITSSSRGVVPVVEIDGISIGDGLPGVKTMSIRHEYIRWMQSHLEPL